MALEERIAELTAALTANTAAIKAGGGAAAGKPGRPAGSTNKDKAADKPSSKHKADDVKAKLLEVKEKVDAATAKSIITDTGGADDMADLLASKKSAWDDVMEACESALEDAGGGDEL